ncbi:MAG: SGNH/GDSL hydrolase family protein [Pseudomonadota bacterium]
MSWLVKGALSPLLLWQGWRVRKSALRLPEAAGPREGRVAWAGDPPGLNLLVVGDSSAAGVGVVSQNDALAAPLAAALASRLRVPIGWQLLATSGHGAEEALRALREAPQLQPADLMLVVVGVNDAVAMTGTRSWLATLDALHAVAVERAGVRLCWHSGLPPMGRFPLLPQPLRWVLGREAARLDGAMRQHLSGHVDRHWIGLPETPPGALPEGWMAADGYHPGPLGYTAWVGALADVMAEGVLPARVPSFPVLSAPAAPHAMQ